MVRGLDGGGRPQGREPGGLSALSAAGGGADPARGVRRGRDQGLPGPGIAAGGPTLSLLRVFGVSAAREGAGEGVCKGRSQPPPASGSPEQLGIVEGSEDWVSGGGRCRDGWRTPPLRGREASWALGLSESKERFSCWI